MSLLTRLVKPAISNVGRARFMSQKVTDWDKRYLVWIGKYKSIAEVPENLSLETIVRARSKVRIKIANYSMVATLLACVGFALSGRMARDRGESVQKMNLEWHESINKEK